jgi:TRAP-type transport system small permease protein
MSTFPMRPFIRLLERFEEMFLVALMVVLILLSSAQIALRNLFAVTLPWADPLIRHLVLWSGFVGALIATRFDKHIHIDSLLRPLLPRPRALVQALTGLFSALVCILMTWVSLQFVAAEKSYGHGSLLGIPTWGLQLVFPLAYGLLALRFLCQSAHRLHQSVRGNPA